MERKSFVVNCYYYYREKISEELISVEEKVHKLLNRKNKILLIIF